MRRPAWFCMLTLVYQSLCQSLISCCIVMWRSGPFFWAGCVIHVVSAPRRSAGYVGLYSSQIMEVDRCPKDVIRALPTKGLLLHSHPMSNPSPLSNPGIRHTLGPVGGVDRGNRLGRSSTARPVTTATARTTLHTTSAVASSRPSGASALQWR